MTDKESTSIDGNEEAGKKEPVRNEAYDDSCAGCTGDGRKFRIDGKDVYAVVCRQHLAEAVEQLCREYPHTYSFELSRLNHD